MGWRMCFTIMLMIPTEETGTTPILSDPTNPDPNTPHPDPIQLIDDIYVLCGNDYSERQVELNEKSYTLLLTFRNV